MGIELMGAVTPIYMVGESHSLVFSNLLFRPEGATETYLCRTRFLPTLMAAQYSSGNELSAEYVNALIAEGIFDATPRPAFLHAEPSAAFLAGMPVLSPPMVLFAGDLDLHRFFRQVGETYDFILPDDPGYGIDKTRQNLPFADVHTHLAGLLAPFFNAVTLLKRVGLTRVMIHCLPPRTPNNDAAAPWTGGIVVPAAVRAKLTVVANRLIAQFCAEAGLPFIDTWPELTAGGFLRPEFELDGAHVNRQSALVSLDKIAAHLSDHTAGIWNGVRYKHAFAQADPVEPADNAEQWAKTGLVGGQLGADFAAQAADALLRELTGGNRHARPDWIGRPRAGCAGLSLAEPSDALLAEATRLLGQGEGLALLQAGADRELTVTSFRPARYAPEADDIAPLPGPPGTRRGLIFLSPTDRLTFETGDGQPLPGPAPTPGAIVVYDPRRARPKIAAGAESLDVIELALGPKLAGQAFRTVWAGLCDWPADPFLYSVAGMKAAPAFAEPTFKARSLW